MNNIDMLLAMKGLQDKVETLTTEMTKATIVINQLMGDVEVLQIDHDKMLDVIDLQAKLNIQNSGTIATLVTTVERLEKAQKGISPFNWPSLNLP